MLFPGFQIKTFFCFNYLFHIFIYLFSPRMATWHAMKCQRFGRCQRHRNSHLADCLLLYFGEDKVVRASGKHKAVWAFLVHKLGGSRREAYILCRAVMANTSQIRLYYPDVKIRKSEAMVLL